MDLYGLSFPCHEIDHHGGFLVTDGRASQELVPVFSPLTPPSVPVPSLSSPSPWSWCVAHLTVTAPKDPVLDFHYPILCDPELMPRACQHAFSPTSLAKYPGYWAWLPPRVALLLSVAQARLCFGVWTLQHPRYPRHEGSSRGSRR